MLCDAESLKEDLKHLQRVFKQNGYSHSYIRWALQQNLEELKLINKKLTCTAMIEFHHTISNKISRLLRKHGVRTIHIPKRKPVQMLRPAKNSLELKVLGVYWILHECGKVYVGQSCRTVEARCKEHQRYIASTQEISSGRT
jgi:hypothetical protein